MPAHAQADEVRGDGGPPVFVGLILEQPAVEGIEGPGFHSQGDRRWRLVEQGHGERVALVLGGKPLDPLGRRPQGAVAAEEVLADEAVAVPPLGEIAVH